MRKKKEDKKKEGRQASRGGSQKKKRGESFSVIQGRDSAELKITLRENLSATRYINVYNKCTKKT